MKIELLDLKSRIVAINAAQDHLIYAEWITKQLGEGLPVYKRPLEQLNELRATLRFIRGGYVDVFEGSTSAEEISKLHAELSTVKKH